jgi:hypothetical protein
LVTSVTCQQCGRSPARTFTIRRHVGLLVLMRLVRIRQTLCRECARRELKRYTGRTLVQGWWGVLSLLVFNPATILLNLWGMARAGLMQRPELSRPIFGDGSVEPVGAESRRMLLPVGVGLLCLFAVAGVAWHF